MREIFNKIIAKYLELRFRKIEKFKNYPFESQDKIFSYLIDKGSETLWGRKYGYKKIKSYKDFNNQVPVSVYDELKPLIDQMMHGKRNILWPGQVSMFSKSSGTTEDKSKFIPVTKENLVECHIKGAWDAVSILYKLKPDSRLFAKKNLVMGGSIDRFEEYPDTMIGDISGLMLYNMPMIGRPFNTPGLDVALEKDWNKKIPKMAEIASKEDVAIFGGVPSWLLVLFKEILRITGKDNLFEVWPNLEAYMHGGVNFTPYRKQYEEMIPKKNFLYINVYNSSEGYFATQNEFSSDNEDMLLLLDSQVFYEFIPFEQYGNENPDVISLRDVELDKNYVLIISTNSGLWRYVVGDTIQFTSLRPFKIKITGRTKHFINVFGEEVMVSNTDKALEKIGRKHDFIINEYTVGPVFMEGGHRGGHQWVIEFEKLPQDIRQFEKDLDMALQNINSDYEAKRYNDLALKPLSITSVPRGTFYKWMESRGKLGGQNKVPRLSNSRRYVEELCDIATIS